MDYKKINDYLWYGYLPSCEASSLGLVKESQEIVNPDWSPRGASEQLDHLFDKLVDATDPPHCVPLSGGWDSRIILAALRKRLNRDEIFCISFGCPGQLDYDIGKNIADSVGVQHYPVNLNNIEVTWEGLKKSVTKSAWTYVPDGYVQQAMFSIAEKINSTLWIGFLGDPLTGGHHQQKKHCILNEELLESFSIT